MSSKVFLKNLVVAIVASIMVFQFTFSTNVAATTKSQYESKLREIKSKYGKENVQFEDGLALNVGQTLDLSTYLEDNEGSISNESEEILVLNEGVVSANKAGSGFISITIGDTVHVVEIVVFEEAVKYNSIAKSTVVDRDYYKVYIDPGHGGEDPGAVANGIKEADLNLSISLKVRTKLENKGVEVEMSRTDNTTVPLYDRPAMANQYGADVFMSIHQNSYSSSSVNGVETFHHSDKSQDKPFATVIQNAIISKTKANSRGVKAADYAVVREAQMTSALIECGFITNATEVNKLKQDSYQELIATAIADSVYNYLQENIKLGQLIFSDIRNHWAEDVIKDFAKKGYITTSHTTFRPNDSITRAEFVKIVNKVFGFTNAVATENFTDVEKGQWFYDEVRIALKAGYITSKHSTFRPNDPITREEVASIVTTIKNNKDSNFDKLNRYSDAYKVSEWAKTSVEGAIERGYMGKEENVFRPKDNITRAEGVATLSRVN